MASVRQVCGLYLLLALLIAAHIGLWQRTHALEPRWLNVPPAPGPSSVKGLGMGDSQLAYRSIGIMLQNMGDMEGKATALKDYNYDRLGEWFRLADQLDPRSISVPVLAAFYFGATQNPKQLPPVIDYLETVGNRKGEQDWHWLVQAMFLARFRENDMPRALTIANEIQAQYQPGRPLWMKEMPAFVMTAAGDRQAAYKLMLATLKEEQGKVQQAEINSTIVFICSRILDAGEAKSNPLCHTIPQNWISRP